MWTRLQFQVAWVLRLSRGVKSQPVTCNSIMMPRSWCTLCPAIHYYHGLHVYTTVATHHNSMSVPQDFWKWATFSLVVCTKPFSLWQRGYARLGYIVVLNRDHCYSGPLDLSLVISLPDHSSSMGSLFCLFFLRLLHHIWEQVYSHFFSFIHRYGGGAIWV